MAIKRELIEVSSPSSVSFSSDRLLPLVDTHHSCLRCISQILYVAGFFSSNWHCSICWTVCSDWPHRSELVIQHASCCCIFLLHVSHATEPFKKQFKSSFAFFDFSFCVIFIESFPYNFSFPVLFQYSFTFSRAELCSFSSVVQTLLILNVLFQACELKIQREYISFIIRLHSVSMKSRGCRELSDFDVTKFCEYWKLVNVWQCDRQEQSVLCFWLTR